MESEELAAPDVLADQSAPEQEETATPAPVEAAPDEETAEPQQPRTFTQEELDAAIGKRLAREQRKWERQQALKTQTPASLPAENLSLEDFETPEAYADALAERKAQDLLARREADQQKFEITEAYHEREEEARVKYDDFEQVAYNPKLPITVAMAETIQASEIGPEIAYHLGSNPKEADRISKLSPFLQAKEIGRIEAKLVAEPPVKKTSKAPAPITPVTARASGTPARDTTDPRSIETMSTSEWIAAERQRQIRKAEAQRIR